MKRYLIIFFVIALFATACSSRNEPGEMAPDADPDNLPNLVGTYVVNGIDPLGDEYGGHLTITPGDEPGTYHLQWIVHSAPANQAMRTAVGRTNSVRNEMPRARPLDNFVHPWSRPFLTRPTPLPTSHALGHKVQGRYRSPARSFPTTHVVRVAGVHHTSFDMYQ